MKVYTRTGDDGTTGLFGGGRVSKDDPRVVAYGEVDELNSSVGWALTVVRDATVKRHLEAVQHDLFIIGADLASPPAESPRKRADTPPLPLGRIAEMERWMDAATEGLEPLRHFVVPGGSPGAAALHLSRTVCRRAERAVVGLVSAEAVEPGVGHYLNRLSDLLFVYARVENAEAGVGDVIWRSEGADPAI